MLSNHLQRFNKALSSFKTKFPRVAWSEDFKKNLINDYSFSSSRIEDSNLEYGDTIKFLNDEFVKKENLTSLLQINNHKEVLTEILDRYENFELTEETIKAIHKNLMGSELSWNGNFKPELVGNYRNYQVIGYREPFYRNREYNPHYNLEIIMATYIDFFQRAFNNIDNSNDETHLITALAYFHNKFLNDIHPFADGNGRVCRIIMGTVMMKNGCPPVFAQVLDNTDMEQYINTIIECEKENSNKAFVDFLANGMSDYLENKLITN
ncbi:Fic/DOC family protein [Pedobacter steynii]|uniref:Fic/DOC family protein n=1 Tax=Pedobacter steynii TaxID=430522 RepID=A0A1G9MY30_9SPHI|nr:Fic family protein [Pedobacter steynii]NQX39463.1 Fic family protein [Pedobacter steynii]SDL79138.1 Fic/DOC family protein [Pedobacter steynii]